MAKMKNASISEREEYLIVKDKKFTEIECEKLKLDNFNKERDELKEDIDKKLKERTLQQKQLKKQEDVEHNTDEEIVNLINKLKKTEN